MGAGYAMARGRGTFAADRGKRGKDFVNQLKLIRLPQFKEAEVLAGVNAHAVVYQVLDEVLSGECLPAGARGAIFSVVDQLRAVTGDADEVRRAERVSIEIHKLEWALRRGDVAAAGAAREELKVLSAEWINTRIQSRH
jgi:hypothetical protein